MRSWRRWLLWLELLDVCSTLTAVDVYKKPKGADVTFRCWSKIDLSVTRRVFCKNDCEEGDVLVQTSGNKEINGRYSIKHEKKGSPPQDIIGVTISNLTLNDSGRYRCFWDSPVGESFSEFRIDVTDGLEKSVLAVAAGEDFSRSFTFSIHGKKKNFCRNSCSDEDILVGTTGDEGKSGRYKIVYKRYADDWSDLTVIIRNMSVADSGVYRTELDGKYRQFWIDVAPVPPGVVPVTVGPSTVPPGVVPVTVRPSTAPPGVVPVTVGPSKAPPGVVPVTVRPSTVPPGVVPVTVRPSTAPPGVVPVTVGPSKAPPGVVPVTVRPSTVPPGVVPVTVRPSTAPPGVVPVTVGPSKAPPGVVPVTVRPSTVPPGVVPVTVRPSTVPPGVVPVMVRPSTVPPGVVPVMVRPSTVPPGGVPVTVRPSGAETQNLVLILGLVLVCVNVIITGTILIICCRRRKGRRTGAGGRHNPEREYENVRPESERIYEDLCLEGMEPNYSDIKRD